MEESVALDTSKQKQFVKSVQWVKNSVKKNKPILKGSSITKVTKKPKKERGLVYLSHIPHGFYENEMTQYFKQFGVVTNVRVIRSKRTGKSKGCAFIEFKEPVVAQIAAESMNNYIMGKRLLKAKSIPPEEQRKAFRKKWSTQYNPGRELKIKLKKAYNKPRDEDGELKKAKKLLHNWEKTRSKLIDLGINYGFSPVDVPEPLLKQEKEIKSSTKTQKKHDSDSEDDEPGKYVRIKRKRTN